ncbi:hypothetical protein BB558_007070 [Smittium angustum]|uniref:Endonuclease/exonuclease/phosphatase domain-containing protein n=1 Tax=Smittium angustum TaxID=133377 RepID=A0A2U1IW11_SMIAN|nr:hypothetical protein BB558_007070 [Smittium angustum]
MVVLGDFNLVRDNSIDRFLASKKSNKWHKLDGLLEKLNLKHLNKYINIYTRVGNTSNHLKLFTALNSEIEQKILRDTSLWKMNNSLLDDSSLIDSIEPVIKEFSHSTIDSKGWELLKEKIKDTYIQYSTSKSRSINVEMESLYSKLSSPDINLHTE